MIVSVHAATRGFISSNIPLGVVTDGLVWDYITLISLLLKPLYTNFSIGTIMKTIEIKRIGHKLQSLELGASVSYDIDMTEHLHGDTIGSRTFAVYDEDSEDVTVDFGRGNSVTGNTYSFGINAFGAGVYTVLIWITCNEYLPDGVTLRKFKVELLLTIK